MSRLVAAAAILAGLVLGPSGALAHGEPGTASDLRTELRALEPSLAPVALRAFGEGDKLELRWFGNGRLIILGYLGEPYLRLGPGGAFENVTSPSVAVARGGRLEDLPDRAAGRVEWRRIGDSALVVWHDRRIAAPASGGVGRWAIPVRVAGRPGRLVGVVRREPGLRPWPALVIGLGLALAGILTVRRASLRLGRAVSVGAGALGMVAVVAVGVDQALAIPTVGLASGAEPDSPPLLAAGLWIGACVTALALIAASRRRPQLQAIVLLGGACLIAGTGLLGRLDHFVLPELPGSLPDGLTRALLLAAAALTAIPVAWAWRLLGPGQHPPRGGADTPRAG